jgi:hypothetical protein
MVLCHKKVGCPRQKKGGFSVSRWTHTRRAKLYKPQPALKHIVLMARFPSALITRVVKNVNDCAYSHVSGKYISDVCVGIRIKKVVRSEAWNWHSESALHRRQALKFSDLTSHTIHVATGTGLGSRE